jgi:DNA-directed RNA polymerase beta subunit
MSFEKDIEFEQFDLENDQYIETPWNIIESYFRGQHLERLVRHQLESYNNFVGYQISKTIEIHLKIFHSKAKTCLKWQKICMKIITQTTQETLH